MDISVIIPSYNRSHTLSRALDSVLAQRFPATEIIVVDDASVDDTAAVVSRYEQVRYHKLEHNQGVSFARNKGIQCSRGEWIALLDSDDAWMPAKLEKQVEAIAAHPQIRVFHTDEIWIRNGRRVNPMKKHAKPEGWVYNDSLALCCVSPSSILLHRSVLETCGDFDVDLPACEDYDLWLRVFCRYQLKLVAEPLVIKHGGHEDQLSRKYWGMDRFRIIALQKMLDNPDLDVRFRVQTVQTLLEKCRVLINGAEKRGHRDRVAHYRNIVSQYCCTEFEKE